MPQHIPIQGVDTSIWFIQAHPWGSAKGEKRSSPVLKVHPTKQPRVCCWPGFWSNSPQHKSADPQNQKKRGAPTNSEASQKYQWPFTPPPPENEPKSPEKGPFWKGNYSLHLPTIHFQWTFVRFQGGKPTPFKGTKTTTLPEIKIRWRDLYFEASKTWRNWNFAINSLVCIEYLLRKCLA